MGVPRLVPFQAGVPAELGHLLHRAPAAAPGAGAPRLQRRDLAPPAPPRAAAPHPAHHPHPAARSGERPRGAPALGLFHCQTDSVGRGSPAGGAGPGWGAPRAPVLGVSPPPDPDPCSAGPAPPASLGAPGRGAAAGAAPAAAPLPARGAAPARGDPPGDPPAPETLLRPRQLMGAPGRGGTPEPRDPRPRNAGPPEPSEPRTWDPCSLQAPGRRTPKAQDTGALVPECGTPGPGSPGRHEPGSPESQDP